MCDKQVYKMVLPEKTPAVLLHPEHEEGGETRSRDKDPAPHKKRTMSMMPFLRSGHSVTYQRQRHPSVQDTNATPLLRDGVLPMHKDDLSALRAWVEAKQQQEELWRRAGKIPVF